MRKSLITAEQVGSHVRYGLLETVRQFAGEQLAATGPIDEVRDRHARYFADKADAILELWASPQQRAAYQWINIEFANLRTGFRWAAGHDHLHSAASIAISASIAGMWIQRYEQFAWAEELLDSAIHHGIRRLPSLYAAAAHCFLTGRIDDALSLAEPPSISTINPTTTRFPSPTATSCWARRIRTRAKWTATCRPRPPVTSEPTTGCRQDQSARLRTRSRKTLDEAQTMAEEAVAATTARGIPSPIAFALVAYGRAFAETDPAQALAAMRRGLAVAHDSDNTWQEAMNPNGARRPETAHGDAGAALESLRRVIDSQDRAGDVVTLTYSLSHLAVLFDRLGRPEPAATLFGTVARMSPSRLAELSSTIEHLNHVIGSANVEQQMRVGGTMDRRAATLYALSEIERARNEQPHGE